MRRAALICSSLAILLLALVLPAGGVAAPAKHAPSPDGGAAASKSWAEAQISSVIDAGLMGADVATFRPDDDLTAGELWDVLVFLGQSPPSHWTWIVP